MDAPTEREAKLSCDICRIFAEMHEHGGFAPLAELQRLLRVYTAEEVADQAAGLHRLYASEKRAKIERGNMLMEAQNALDRIVRVWDTKSEACADNTRAGEEMVKIARVALQSADEPGPHYVLVGYNGNGTPCTALTVYAATASLDTVRANGVLMFHDAGYPHVKSVEAISWPTRR